jgi:hypothetical protein
MSADETLNAPPLTFDPDNPGRNIVRRCRSLTVKGAPCRQAALREQDFCVRHIDRGPHTLTRPGQILVPLLEDHSAIQLTCTRIAHAVLSGSVAPLAANSALSACRIANSSLPRPPRLTTSAEPEPVPQPLTGIALDESNNFIAPREPWLDAAGNLAQYDNFAARFTDQKIDPDTAVTERYRNLIFELVQQRANRDTAESAAALAAGLPEPHPGKWYAFKTGHCAFLTAFCHGPLDPEPCDFCLGVEQMPSDHSYYPGDDAVAIVTALRNHLQQQKLKPKQAQQQKENESQHPSQISQISAAVDAGRVPHPGCVPHLHARRMGPTRRRARRTSRSYSVNLNATADFSNPAPALPSGCAPGSHQRRHRAQRDTVEERAFRPASTPETARALAPATENITPAQAHVVKLVNAAIDNISKDKKLVPAQKHKIQSKPGTAPNPKRTFRKTAGSPAGIHRSLPLLTLDRQRARYFAAERDPALSEPPLSEPLLS